LRAICCSNSAEIKATLSVHRKKQAATLQINTRTEHIRFRYMHMNPSNLDADGILNGRLVTARRCGGACAAGGRPSSQRTGRQRELMIRQSTRRREMHPNLVEILLRH
jgi:hypothetical protein